MIESVHAAAQAVPGYCTSGHGVLTHAEWQTCWKLGWNQSSTGTATVGYSAGHNVAPILIGLLILAVIVAAASRGRSRSPATSK